jgi:hypothetical protein
MRDSSTTYGSVPHCFNPTAWNRYKFGSVCVLGLKLARREGKEMRCGLIPLLKEIATVCSQRWPVPPFACLGRASRHRWNSWLTPNIFSELQPLSFRGRHSQGEHLHSLKLRLAAFDMVGNKVWRNHTLFLWLELVGPCPAFVQSVLPGWTGYWQRKERGESGETMLRSGCLVQPHAKLVRKRVF